MPPKRNISLKRKIESEEDEEELNDNVEIPYQEEVAKVKKEKKAGSPTSTH